MYETWDEESLTSSMKSVPEVELYSRRIDALAGRGLGGTTTINAGLYTRPRHEDFDEWGVEGWTSTDSKRYFERLEDHELSGPVHGQGGPLRIELGEVQTIAQHAMSAADALGIPISSDSASGEDDIGISFARRTIKDGKRQDAFSAYLKPVLNRTNLQVRTNSRVVKVNLDQDQATGVSYLAFGVNQLSVKAKREVILSAGVYGSPQLLLLSGIGPEADLSAKRITPQVNLPVGQSLIARPMANLLYSGTQLSPEQDLQNLELNSTAWQQFQATGSGVLSLTAASIYSALKSNPALPAPDFIFELAGVLPSFQTVPTAVLASCQLAAPVSKGSVTLNQPNPFVPPAISLNLLADDEMAPLLNCLEMSRSLLGHPTMLAHTGMELTPGMAVQGPDLENYVRSNGRFAYHAVGTCRLGADDDPDAVVDNRLRVRGVGGLRVVDASVIPKLPRSGLMSVVYMVGEAAAEMIAEDHQQPSAETQRTRSSSPEEVEPDRQLEQIKDWLWQCSSVEKEPYLHPKSDDLKQQAEDSAWLVLKVTAFVLAIGCSVEIIDTVTFTMKQQKATQNSPQIGDNSKVGMIGAAHDWTDQAILNIFARLASCCAAWPERVIAGTWIVCMLCCCGFYWLELNDDISIWIPSNSRVEPEFGEVQHTFPDLRQQAFLVEREDGGNVLEPGALANVRTIMSAVLSIQTSSGVSAANVCVKLPGTDLCLIEGPLEALASAAHLGTSLLSSAITMTQKPILEVLRSPVVTDSGEITSATGIYIQFYCEDIQGDAVTSWEDAFEKADLLGSLTTGPTMRVLKNSHGAYHDAVNWTIIGAIPYYIMSAFFMQVYIFISFGSKNSASPNSQVTLGLCGETAVLMASLSAAGTYSALGYEVTHISVCVLFLLMGIGLDDMFVLMKAFEREDITNGVEARLVASMQEAGSSITVTTVTNIVAFTVGGQLPFPALSAFCIFLALGVGFVLFFFLLFFVSCMVIDEHRKQQGNVDLIFRPFVSRGANGEEAVDTEGDHSSGKERDTCADDLATQSNTVMGVDTFNSDPKSSTPSEQEQTPDQLYLFIERYWAPCILHASAQVRLMWFGFYVFTFCVAMYGIFTVQITPQRKKMGLQADTDLME